MAAQGPKRTITISLTSKKCGPGDSCHILIDIFQYVHSTGSVGVQTWPENGRKCGKLSKKAALGPSNPIVVTQSGLDCDADEPNTILIIFNG